MAKRMAQREDDGMRKWEWGSGNFEVEMRNAELKSIRHGAEVKGLKTGKGAGRSLGRNVK